MWIKDVDKKVKIGSLHNSKIMLEKNDQTFKMCKKVIHIQKCGKMDKITLINGVIHFIHIKKLKKRRFT
jgi:hypothetical protein